MDLFLAHVAVHWLTAPAAYWHESLVAARAHTSVLSANNQVLSALSGLDAAGGALMQADTVQTGIAAAGSRTTSLDSPWLVDDKVSCNARIRDHSRQSLAQHIRC